MYINHAHHEINCKLVYYGPGLAGKTTNAIHVHKVMTEQKGQKVNLVQLATEAERTLYFDFLPIQIGSIAGYDIRLHLYTVPGQHKYMATRRLVMRGLDGVVFVADSQAQYLDSNIVSLEFLEDDLAHYGYDPVTTPRVIQYNKRDTPTALPVERLRAALNPHDLPEILAEAHRGRGVFRTLQVLTRLVLRDISRRVGAPIQRATG